LGSKGNDIFHMYTSAHLLDSIIKYEFILFAAASFSMLQ
jgi:hypothetical protein